MALRKSIELEMGISGDYWRVDKITADRRLNLYTIEVALYLSKAARDAGKSPAYAATFTTVDPAIATGSACATAEAYAHLKLLPEFSGAEDA